MQLPRGTAAVKGRSALCHCVLREGERTGEPEPEDLPGRQHCLEQGQGRFPGRTKRWKRDTPIRPAERGPPWRLEHKRPGRTWK